MNKEEIGKGLSALFVPLVDNYHARRECLGSQGFLSLFSLMEFDESFCRNDAELAQLRQVHVEIRKEGLPWSVYHSPFLDKLRDESRDWLNAHPGIVDAMPEVLCEPGRRKVELLLRDNVEFQRQRAMVADGLKQKHETEIQRQASDISLGLDLSMGVASDQRKIWERIVEAMSNVHEFSEDLSLSKNMRATRVYCKSLTADWKLAMWADAEGFANAQLKTPTLEVVFRILPTGSSTTSLSSSYLFALWWFLPLEVAFKFNRLVELEYFARGVLSAVSLVAPDVERSLNTLSAVPRQ